MITTNRHDTDLAVLRGRVQASMSPKRYAHTAAVEDMVARLAALYCPHMTDSLRVAALLHDITKEYTVDQHAEILNAAGKTVTDADRLAHKTLHARSAVVVIAEQYADFADETVLSAVRWHTTGHADMTLAEQLLYLADYIDDSRLFPDCVRLRTLFWDAHPEQMSEQMRLSHLHNIIILSFDMTIRALINEGAIVSPDTICARNALVLTEAQKKQ